VAIHQELEVNQPFNFHKTVTSLSSFLASKNTSVQDFPVQRIEVVPIANQLKASSARVASVQEIEEVRCRSLERFFI